MKMKRGMIEEKHSKRTQKSKDTKRTIEKQTDDEDEEENEAMDSDENNDRETADSFTSQYTMYESPENTLVPDKAVRENYNYVTDVSENELITTSNFIEKFASELQVSASVCINLSMH
ncbi:hypothetical protein LXL04_002947 [Taraxacum kok-saghyz]